MDDAKNEIKKILISIPTDLLESVETYQFGNRIKHRSDAIKELLQKALEEEK